MCSTCEALWAGRAVLKAVGSYGGLRWSVMEPSVLHRLARMRQRLVLPGPGNRRSRLHGLEGGSAAHSCSTYRLPWDAPVRGSRHAGHPD